MCVEYDSMKKSELTMFYERVKCDDGSSLIIRNGYVIGAVTYLFISNSMQGHEIFI